MTCSAGIVLWRERSGGVEVLLGHMGGPYWSRREAGAWTIPKGEVEAGEEPIAVARREFAEEIGRELEEVGAVGAMADLGEIRQRGGKVVRAWAVRVRDDVELDLATLVSNTFEIEWPPRSGRMQSFPELDRVAWFDLDAARDRIITGQRELLDRLASTQT